MKRALEWYKRCHLMQVKERTLKVLRNRYSHTHIRIHMKDAKIHYITKFRDHIAIIKTISCSKEQLTIS